MICIYSADCTDFTNNGLGVVVPTSCSVTETLNGEWELTLEHPIDDAGKWRRLVEGRILRVPVPAASRAAKPHSTTGNPRHRSTPRAIAAKNTAVAYRCMRTPI